MAIMQFRMHETIGKRMTTGTKSFSTQNLEKIFRFHNSIGISFDFYNF